MRNTQTFFAVQLPAVLAGRKPRLAVGKATAGPGLYYWPKDARKFKHDLQSEGFKGARVVKVTVTYSW